MSNQLPIGSHFVTLILTGTAMMIGLTKELALIPRLFGFGLILTTSIVLVIHFDFQKEELREKLKKARRRKRK